MSSIIQWIWGFVFPYQMQQYEVVQEPEQLQTPFTRECIGFRMNIQPERLSYADICKINR